MMESPTSEKQHPHVNVVVHACREDLTSGAKGSMRSFFLILSVRYCHIGTLVETIAFYEKAATAFATICNTAASCYSGRIGQK
jgi:hypothetical protein